MRNKLTVGLLLFIPAMAFADPNTWSLPDADEWPEALRLFALMTLLGLTPALLIMLSSFTRIIVVLSILRTALGLQQTPPNMVLMSLALFLTCMTMMPVANRIYTESFIPWEAHQISTETALLHAQKPIRAFLLRQTREKDVRQMAFLAKAPLPKRAEDVQFHYLVPAFLLSELQTAFQIGFMIFLPFLLVDLVVSGILMTMGMMMVPPMSIALPIKLLLFVLIDGWSLVVQSLVGSFHGV
ncbi:flagellar type III secretion system pore protein FliP [Legionella geestiana]|uniref:flagellar type III secretion system pore protein FliP n=1 Tax=Legionella geestiana TaxID=45065 RepID=UPI001091F207|nr:flagellar type III secretion system pore protein FliP [Legionella geestiana]QDQ39646.1 flagellar type III secretion system pore protein FliP [Legionella geestiana]